MADQPQYRLHGLEHRIVESHGFYERREQAHQCRGRIDGGEVEGRVADSGVGIPMELSKTNFEPFYTAKGQSDGSELLSLCSVRSIVEESEGRFPLASKHSRETELVSHLPSHDGGLT
jgi:C4-dicarboxylate-specific signal transduction histidine kinase